MFLLKGMCLGGTLCWPNARRKPISVLVLCTPTYRQQSSCSVSGVSYHHRKKLGRFARLGIFNSTIEITRREGGRWTVLRPRKRSFCSTETWEMGHVFPISKLVLGVVYGSCRLMFCLVENAEVMTTNQTMILDKTYQGWCSWKPGISWRNCTEKSTSEFWSYDYAKKTAKC